MHFAAVPAIACTLPACSIKEQRTTCPAQVNVSFTAYQIHTEANQSRSVQTKVIPAPEPLSIRYRLGEEIDGVVERFCK